MSKFIYLLVFSFLSFSQHLPAKSQLYKAILKDDHEKVQRLIQEENENVNQTIFKETSPLFLASRQGSDKIVATLLTAGASIDAISFKEYTPLMIAAENGHHAVVKLLLEGNARTDHKTNLGLDALMLAARGKDIQTIKLLIDVLPINGQDNKGNTPLMHCVLAGDNAEILKLLKEKADETIINSGGYTAEKLAEKMKRARINEIFNPKEKRRRN